MTQTERRIYLIEALKREEPQLSALEIPAEPQQQKRLLRALMNVRPPRPASRGFLAVQDAYLRQETQEKGVVTLESLKPCGGGLYLWRGDITRLAVDAIVNAANDALLGCFVPCHGCIDNAIHSAAGIQLRLECAALMEKQGTPEPTGRAKLTRAYALPCRYVLHTVGPIIRGPVTAEDCAALESCYTSCLTLAAQNGLESVAFCCISTGEFHFPNERAAQIAVSAAARFLQQTSSSMKVIFDVFQDRDVLLYRRLLG